MSVMLLLMLLLPGWTAAGRAPVQPPLAAATATGEQLGCSADAVVTTHHFAFHSHPWVNLHHLLYQWARQENRAADDRRRPVTVTETIDELTAAHRAAWQQAVDFYAAELISRDLLFDPEMRSFNSRLMRTCDLTDLDIGGLPGGLTAVLASAAPVYAASWWPTHDAVNRRWIDDLQPRLARFEKPIADRVAAAYGGRWPDTPMHVDVTYYANWAGAYTSNHPSHVTLASADPDVQEYAALEIVMHESSHIDSLEGVLTEGIEDAFTAQDSRPPRRLWHVVIFYTTGKVTQAVLKDEGIDYTPYAWKTGLIDRVAGWRDAADALDIAWAPFLAGRTDRGAAFTALAAEMTKPGD